MLLYAAGVGQSVGRLQDPAADRCEALHAAWCRRRVITAHDRGVGGSWRGWGAALALFLPLSQAVSRHAVKQRRSRGLSNLTMQVTADRRSRGAFRGRRRCGVLRRSSAADDARDYTASLAALKEAFPTAEEEELLRFATARWKEPSAAKQMYATHLRWRESDGRPDGLAAAAAEVPERWLYVGSCCGSEQSEMPRPLVFVQGARYDVTVPPETYTKAVCYALDTAVAGTGVDQVTVLVDVRNGIGWPCPPASQLLPFFRSAAAVVPDNYPERLEQLVVYPVPSIVKLLVDFILRLLDPATRKKVVLLAGSSQEGAPCPAEQLRPFVRRGDLPSYAWEMHEDL
eukprot:TRINITY_DN40404_c0_g1_i1.p1 TRINITY_DN40404_c0_g1~~TRINITY_DN40404_c0_g1_i1.p1  ORF type:complete len:343 (+),score=52.81 TRINITY_DN40404_c0_g1_i1:142-1170(+)